VNTRAIPQAMEEKHLGADTGPQRMLFDLYSATFGLHHDSRFLRLRDAVRHVGRAGKNNCFVSERKPLAAPLNFKEIQRR
jgi:hypothetical protein